MSIYLDLAARYRTGLDAFDPLRDERVFAVLDPCRGGRTSPWRLLLFALLLFAPEWLLCAIPSRATGGRFYGAMSITADVGLLGITLFAASALFLIPVARRLFGVLISDLVSQQITSEQLRDFRPLHDGRSRLLRGLLRISNIGTRAGLYWLVGLVAQQLLVYSLILLDGTQNWTSSPAVAGSIFYTLRLGDRQPNLAGLWAFGVRGPLVCYLIVVIARLLVVFACLCQDIARDPCLRITPSHPDGVGGLRPVGQVAVFMSLFTFILGVDLAFITLGELILARVSTGDPRAVTRNLGLQLVLWAVYLVVGTLLFFLPLVALRKKMATAKREYLTLAQRARCQLDAGCLAGGTLSSFRSDTLSELSDLDSAYTTAATMAVWPLDRDNLVRYSGLLLSPLTPLLADQLPRVVSWFRSYLGLVG